MLAGLLLAAIPLLIHLFYRRRYQEVRWAAVQFLNAAVRRNAQRHRLQQLLLLVLRTLAIVLLVLAFARPVLRAALGPGGSVASVHHILVLDGSLSMRAHTVDGTCFSDAVAAAREIVRTASEGDSFQLVLMEGDRARPVISRPAWRSEDVLDALRSAKCSASVGVVVPTLELVERWLADNEGTARQRVSILSDFQITQWGQDHGAAVRTRMQAISRDAEIVLVRAGGLLPGNSAVTAVRTNRQFATVNTTVSLDGRVANFSPAPLVDRAVRLAVDGQIVASRNVSVAPWAVESVPFVHTFRSPGTYRISMETDSDTLPDDNRSNEVLTVQNDVPLLLVNGRPSSRRMGNATDFVRLSLSPDPDGDWSGPYDVRVVSEAELTSVKLAEFAAVFLCDIRRFTADEAARLERYVWGGGAVILCPGDNAELSNYNLRLFGQDRLMPVRLDGFVGDAERPAEAWAFDVTQLDHPVVQAYRGNPGHGLERVLTFRYIKATVDEAGASVALRLSNQDPAIVQARHGAGVVCLLAIAADDSRWSTASGTFVTLMNEITEFAVGTARQVPAAIVGRPWQRPVPGPIVESRVSAVVMDGPAADATVHMADATSGSVVLLVPEPGFVSLTVGSRQWTIPANLDPRESDLRGMAGSQLQQEVLGDARGQIAVASDFQAPGAAVTTGPQSEVSFWLLLGGFGLLLAEQLLAGRARVTEWIVFCGILVVLLSAAVVPARQAMTVAAIAALLAFLTIVRRWHGNQRNRASGASR